MKFLISKRSIPWLVLLGFLFFFEFKIETLLSRPGGGGSYRSSSSSSSGSSYRSSSSSSSYRSSYNSSSRSNSYNSSRSGSSNSSNSGNYTYTPKVNYSDYKYINYKIEHKLQENLLVDTKENFDFKTTSSGDVFRHYFFNDRKIDKYNYQYYRIVPSENKRIIKFSNPSLFFSEDIFTELISIKGNYSYVEMLYLKGNFKEDSHAESEYYLSHSFVYSPSDESYLFSIPLLPVSGDKSILPYSEFEITFPVPVNDLSNLVINKNDNPIPQSNLQDFIVKESFASGKIIPDSDGDKYEMVFKISKRLFQYEQYKSLHLFHKKRGKIFSMPKIRFNLSLLQSGELETKAKINAGEESYSFLSCLIPGSHKYMSGESYSSNWIYLTENVVSTSNPDVFTYFSHYEDAYNASYFKIRPEIEFGYKTYGNLVPDKDSVLLIWSIDLKGEWISPDLEIVLNLPEGIDSKEVDILSPYEVFGFPYSIRKENDKIIYNIQGITSDDKIILKLKLPKEKVGSLSFFYYIYLAFMHSWRIYSDFYIGFCVIFSIVGVFFFVHKKREWEKEKIQREREAFIKANDSSFSSEFFFEKVRKTAILLTEAWLKGDMNSVRSIVSGGIYNRFKILIDIMKSQGVENYMQDWKILDLELLETSSNDNMDTIHVLLKGQARDANLSMNLDPKRRLEILKKLPLDTYMEVWSFVRRRGAVTQTNRGVLEGICPNCGSLIENLTDQNKCKACTAVFNSGEFDWVLSEITQTVEWISTSNGTVKGWKEFNRKYPVWNRQVIEDRASVLFWKCIQAKLNKSDRFIKRDLFFGRILKLDEEFLLQDAAVGSVDLTALNEVDGFFEANVKIKWSANFPNNGGYQNKHSDMTLRLNPNYEGKFGLAEHGCESCGAPLPEIDSTLCSYCGTEIPEKLSDWLLYGLNF